MQQNRTPGVIAIDFGTTKTSVAWMKYGTSSPGIIKLPPSKNISKCTSASIETAFRCDENGVIEEFGELAYLWKGTFGGRTYYNFKPELTNSENTEAYELSKKWLELILQLIKISMNTDELDDYQFVIGHPVKWTPKSQQKLLQIAKEAGFKKIKSMREPIGAALYLQWAELKKIPMGKSLIIDFGGGTIDFILLDFDGEQIRTIRAGGDDRLGGRNIDELVYNKITELHGFNLDESGALNVDLMRASRYLKEQLSDKPHETYFTSNVNNNSIALKNDDLSLICFPVFKNIQTELLSFLNEPDVPIRIQDIVSVILCGGSTKLLGFRAFIDSIFPGKIYDYSVDSREIIVKGLSRIETVLEEHTDEAAYVKFKRQVEILISNTNQQTETIFGKAHINNTYDKLVEQLLKKHGDGLGVEDANKEFNKLVLKQMSEIVLEDLSNAISNYQNEIIKLLSKPHIIIRETYGKDVILPSSYVSKIYKQELSPEYFYSRMYDGEDIGEILVDIILFPIVILYQILRSKKGRFLDYHSYAVKKYFQYSPPKKNNKLLEHGSYSYHSINQVKADFPELIFIPHFSQFKEFEEGKKKKLIRLISQNDVMNYNNAIDQLWESYCKNFNLGE